jgi:hypothetical protein
MKNDCYLIFVEFGNERRMAALSDIKGVIHTLLPDCNLHVVIVDNATKGNIEICLDPKTNVISGNNNSRDISGYDKGLQWIKDRRQLFRETILFFGNDTIHQSINLPYFRAVSSKVFKKCMRSNSVIGYVDSFPRQVSIGGLPFKSWIRSNLFIIKYKNLMEIGSIEIPFSDDQIFSKKWQDFFSKDSIASPEYKKFLQVWLFGKRFPGLKFSEKWHSCEPLTQNNFSTFKVKTRAILSEHFFSARLKKNKIPVVSVQAIANLNKHLNK